MMALCLLSMVYAYINGRCHRCVVVRYFVYRLTTSFIRHAQRHVLVSVTSHYMVVHVSRVSKHILVHVTRISKHRVVRPVSWMKKTIFNEAFVPTTRYSEQ